MTSCQKCGNKIPIEKERFCDMSGTTAIHSDKTSNLS